MTAAYEFSNGARDIPLSCKSRIHPSTREELKSKLNEGKTLKRATHEVLLERGGMNRVPSAHLIPSITQAYAISRKKSKKSTDQ